MTLARAALLRKAEEFCHSFAHKRDISEILTYFAADPHVTAIEHGLPTLAPFLGRSYVGIPQIEEYFETIESLLEYDEMQFLEYVVDPVVRKVSVKGLGRFVWKSTGVGWDETFTYTLDFNHDLKIMRYQVWADSGAAYLARKGKGVLAGYSP